MHIDGSQIKKTAISYKKSLFLHFLKKYVKYRLQTSSLSTTFLFGPRLGNGYFSIWLRQYALKLIFFKKYSFSLRNTLDTGFSLCRNVHWIIVYNFCKDCMVNLAYWRQFSAIFAKLMLVKSILSPFTVVFWVIPVVQWSCLVTLDLNLDEGWMKLGSSFKNFSLMTGSHSK